MILCVKRCGKAKWAVFSECGRRQSGKYDTEARAQRVREMLMSLGAQLERSVTTLAEYETEYLRKQGEHV